MWEPKLGCRSSESPRLDYPRLCSAHRPMAGLCRNERSESLLSKNPLWSTSVSASREHRYWCQQPLRPASLYTVCEPVFSLLETRQICIISLTQLLISQRTGLAPLLFFGIGAQKNFQHPCRKTSQPHRFQCRPFPFVYTSCGSYLHCGDCGAEVLPRHETLPRLSPRDLQIPFGRTPEDRDFHV